MPNQYSASPYTNTRRLFGALPQRSVLVFVTQHDMSGFGPAIVPPHLSASLSAHDLAAGAEKKCQDKLIVELPALDGMPHSRLALIAKLAHETRSMFYATATAFETVEIDSVLFEAANDCGPPNLKALARDGGKLIAQAMHEFQNSIEPRNEFARWLISGVARVYSTAQ